MKPEMIELHHSYDGNAIMVNPNYIVWLYGDEVRTGNGDLIQGTRIIMLGDTHSMSVKETYEEVRELLKGGPSDEKCSMEH